MSSPEHGSESDSDLSGDLRYVEQLQTIGETIYMSLSDDDIATRLSKGMGPLF